MVRSSFWLKVFIISTVSISANPGKNSFQYKNINLNRTITCSTYDDPSDLDPLNDQTFQIQPSRDFKTPVVKIFSYIDSHEFIPVIMDCNIDKVDLNYNCAQTDYKFFIIVLKNQWHAQGHINDKRVHFQGVWKKNRLHLKPQRIFCHQDLSEN